MKNDHNQLCMKCKYRGFIHGATHHSTTNVICNYAAITGHCRILVSYDPKDCTVYERGKMQRVKQQIRL